LNSSVIFFGKCKIAKKNDLHLKLPSLSMAEAKRIVQVSWVATQEYEKYNSENK